MPSTADYYNLDDSKVYNSNGLKIYSLNKAEGTHVKFLPPGTLKGAEYIQSKRHLYDIEGRKVYSREEVGSNSTKIDALDFDIAGGAALAYHNKCIMRNHNDWVPHNGGYLIENFTMFKQAGTIDGYENMIKNDPATWMNFMWNWALGQPAEGSSDPTNHYLPGVCYMFTTEEGTRGFVRCTDMKTPDNFDSSGHMDVEIWVLD